MKFTTRTRDIMDYIEFAKELFLKQGGIEPVAIIFPKSGSPITLDIMLEHKQSEYHALNLLCLAHEATRMMVVSESWVTLGTENILSEKPNRREALMISDMGQFGIQMHIFEISRLGPKIELDEINLPNALPGTDTSQEGMLTEIFPNAPVSNEHKRKARKEAEKIRKKNRK